MPAHSLLFSKSTKRAARLNVPIRRTNHYQQYYMPYQHTYCGRDWNLIQACYVQSSDYKVYISTLPSSEVKNFQMKIYYRARDRTPDLLNQRQTCYHLSQRGELGLESSIVKEIVQYQNNWKEHVNRMSSDRLPKQALFYNPKGKRDIGWPRTRWKDQFQ